MIFVRIYIINCILLFSSFICVTKTQQNSNHHEFSANNVDQLSQMSRQEANVSVNVATSSVDQSNSMPNFYSNSQAQKFRVNVSNVCEKNQMRITIRFSRPFYGLIHTKDRRKKLACLVEGNGDQTYTLDISYTLVQSETNYCGVVSHHPSGSSLNQSSQQQQQILSVVLVVRLHKSIEFSDDRYFLLSCANRCQRPDCSSSNQDTIIATRQLLPLGAQPFREFATSESIVSPVLQPTTNGLANTTNSKLVDYLAGWTTERCDTMLDFKFQWLIKLCWVLSILLLTMFCTVFFLCLMLNKTQVKHNKQSKKDKGNLFNKSNRSGKQILYSHSNQSENLSWSAKASTSDELDKIREDNSYLAKQHQQLMMANLLAKNSTEIERHQTLECGQNIIVGRSADSFCGAQRRQLEAQVKRRRSIGGSTVALPLEFHQQVRQDNNSKKLDANLRAKSRSQTTIHYEQGQDPFKTVPFSYLNNGYLSDGDITQQRVHLGSSSGALDNYVEVSSQAHQIISDQHLTYPPAQDAAMAECISQPIISEKHMTPTHHPMVTNSPIRLDMMQQQRWPNSKPTFVLPPAPPTQMEKGVNVSSINNHVDQQQQLSSQFDPQNSRQLIDLIHQKHRLQIAQANMTAATLQKPTNFLTELEKQQTLNQQHATMLTQTRAWR